MYAALKSFNGDKALGVDGFTMAFWQFSYEFVKDEIIAFFREFHNQSRFVKSLNATFLALIPKKKEGGRGGGGRSGWW